MMGSASPLPHRMDDPRTMNLLPIACCALAVFSTSRVHSQEPKPKQEPAPKIEWIKEKDTGVKFASRITSDLHDKKITLAGVAVRDKRFVVLVDVYAYALYVDEGAIEENLYRLFGWAAEDLQQSPYFFNSLDKDPVTRTLQLEFVRDVGADTIRDAFVDSVEPRIEEIEKKNNDKEGWKGGAKALKTFRDYFGDEVKEGQKIEFTWLPGDKIITRVAGETLGTIESRSLSWALWDTYFGKDPIESKGKKTAVARLAKRLSKTKRLEPKVEPDKPKPDEKGEKGKEKNGKGKGTDKAE